MATWGIILGLAAFGMGIVGYAVLDDAFDTVDKDLDCISKADNQKQIDACNK